MKTAQTAAAPHAVEFEAWDMTTATRRQFRIVAEHLYMAEELARQIRREYRIQRITITPVAA